MSGKIKVLIVDDSSIVRSMLTRILSSDSEIEVIGAAPDPYVAREKIYLNKPDVITLDVEMPRMDGIEFLEKLMQHYPIPTVIISSLTPKGSQTALKALELGAISVISKPTLDISSGLNVIGAEIITAVKVAAKSNLSAIRHSVKYVQKHTSSSVLKTKAMIKTTRQVVAIGASTGGTQALRALLPMFPAFIPPILIVQHMPPVFTSSFASHLNQITSFEVKEAEDGEILAGGKALIAPGNFHMQVTRQGAQYYVRLNQKPHVHSVRPSVDVLFDSVAEYVGSNAIGVILTGMGKDGAEGLKKMKEAGAFTIAQDEQSCVVFGMPKVAIETGAIDKVLPLEHIAQAIINYLNEKEIL